LRFKERPFGWVVNTVMTSRAISKVKGSFVFSPYRDTHEYMKKTKTSTGTVVGDKARQK